MISWHHDPKLFLNLSFIYLSLGSSSLVPSIRNLILTKPPCILVLELILINHYMILYFVFYFSVSESWMKIAFGNKSGVVRVIIQHPENVSQGLQVFWTFPSLTVLATTTASQPDKFTDSDKIVLNQEKDHELMIQKRPL